jgi:hypothetical protein
MHSYDSATLAAYAKGRYGVHYMLRCDVAEGAVGFWTGAGVTTMGGVDYAGTGTVDNIGDAPTNTQLQPQKMTFTLSGLEMPTLQLVFNYTWKGRDAVLYRMLRSSETGAVIGTPRALFRGEMDVIALKGGGSDNVGRLDLDVESKLRTVTRTFPGTRSDAWQRRRDAGDQFDKYVGVANRTLWWGQKPETTK